MQITWYIDNAQVKTSPVEGMADVVASCQWRVSATEDVTSPDGEIRTLEADASGFVAFENPDPASFIPFDQITQETMKPWVWAKLDLLDKNALEAQVTAKLEELKNPPLENRNIPL